MSPNKRYVALGLIALNFFCVTPRQVAAYRAKGLDHAAVGKVCQISEKKNSGDTIYHIGLSLDMEDVGGCKIGKCNFFNMDRLAKSFIEKPVRTPAEGRIGSCSCILKVSAGAQSQAASKLTRVGGKALLNFVSNARDPCTEHGCWLKYNKFVHLATSTSSKFNDSWTRGNHWKFSCAPGEASLADFKTVKEFSDVLPDGKREQMIKHAADAGILPDAPVDDSTERDETNGAPEGGGVSDYDNMEHSGGSKMQDESQGIQEQGDDADRHNAEGRTVVPVATVNRLQKAVDVLMQVEEKLAIMIPEAERCTSNGPDAENKCEALWLNMGVLVKVLKLNVDIGQAFTVATELPNADAAVLEAFLLEIETSMGLQTSIVNNLENILAQGREAAEAMEDHILVQLGEVLKPSVQRSRKNLERALAAITA